MKKISFKNLKFIPSSHEDPGDPGVVKKVIFDANDFPDWKKVKMINWAKLKGKRDFVPHYHEDMEEIFIIISGRVRIFIDNEETILTRGDTVLVPKKSIHRMKNLLKTPLEYIVIGLSEGKEGKTVNVKT